MKTLLALITVVSIPLAFVASREHAYRVRRAAVQVIADHGSVSVDRTGRGEWGPHCHSLGKIHDPSETLGRDDIVVYAICSISDENIAAILRLPTLKALTLNDIGPGWSMFRAPVVPPLGAMDAPLAKIAALPALEELDLRGRSVSDEGIRKLTASRSLRLLDLHETQISDAALHYLSAMPQIEELDLGRTAVTGEGLRHLASLVSLRVLDLSRTNVCGSGFVGLAPLRRLERLDLSYTAATDGNLRHLADLVSLRDLNLNRTKISGLGLKHLATLHRLERLNLCGNSIDDESLRYLAGLSRLEVLKLVGTGITDEGLKVLADIESLQFLDVANCDISDEGLMYLSRSTSLQEIDVVGTKVTRSGAAELKRRSRVHVSGRPWEKNDGEPKAETRASNRTMVSGDSR